MRMRRLLSILCLAVLMISLVFVMTACEEGEERRAPDTKTQTELSQTQAETETQKETQTEVTTLAETVPTEPQTEPQTETLQTEDSYDDGYVSDELAPVVTEKSGRDYVLNTNTNKFHYPSCSHADRIKAHNRQDYCGTREEVISWGYSPCAVCMP